MYIPPAYNNLLLSKSPKNKILLIGTDDAGITLRFGYWGKVNSDELLKLFGDHLFTIDIWECEDDDCGWLYSYILKPINPFA